MRKNILAQKGVVFGLDARLVLAILAIVSLGISLTKETQVKKDFERTTRVKMEFIESKFLQEWERLRFLGFGDNAKADDTDFNVRTVAGNPIHLDLHRTGYTYYSDSESVNYVNPYNNLKMVKIRKDYLKDDNQPYPDFDGNVVMFSNFIESDEHAIAEKDFFMRFIKIVFKYIEEEGRTKIFVGDDESLRYGVSSIDLIMFEKDGFGEPIRIYTILDVINGQEYIANVVLFSRGGNKVLDSKLPKTLEDLKDFKVEGDDIFRIFSTKGIYLKAKAENLHRLKTISRKIESMAESAYATKMSDCSLETSVTSACDKNSDGVFDWKDKNILKNYNPYIRTKTDTISATRTLSPTSYYMRYNYISGKDDSETFIKNGLGLPKYLAYDLFGNILKYDSNVNKTAEGPYTMEVWY